MSRVVHQELERREGGLSVIGFGVNQTVSPVVAQAAAAAAAAAKPVGVLEPRAPVDDAAVPNPVDAPGGGGRFRQEPTQDLRV